jgi:hypothetical protein
MTNPIYMVTLCLLSFSCSTPSGNVIPGVNEKTIEKSDQNTLKASKGMRGAGDYIIHNQQADGQNTHIQIENTVYRIQNKNKGDFINSEFVTLSKYTSEYSLIDNADFIPKSIILRNPPLGYQWRTFFLDSEMNDLLGYKAISLAVIESKKNYIYGGVLIFD